MRRLPMGSGAELRLRWALARDGATVLEEDLVSLLREISRHGTLTAAARAAGVSYRKAWALLSHSTAEVGAPLVVMARGRGSVLTPLGEAVARLDDAVAATITRGLGPQSDEVRHLLGLLPPARNGPVRVRLSHDMFLSDAGASLPQALRDHVELTLDGSINALFRLGRAECEVAGFHGPTGSEGRTAARDIAANLVAPDLVVQPLLRRVQGLMYRHATGLTLRGLHDLLRPGLRFVNRQPGSGTRVLLDALLAESSVPAAKVDGYHREEFTHGAVAAQIVAGSADVGFGTDTAAQMYALDFLPLCQEIYAFAWKEPMSGDAVLNALVAHLRDTLARRCAAPEEVPCDFVDVAPMPASLFVAQYLPGAGGASEG
ncbi:MAG: helix-turn-helix transcriptional regulator [Ectothiorhodospiraceae bacterium]|nr:helix-turn-helix transcriptional regulator [Ectothiorhodospiraceae bacterium]